MSDLETAGTLRAAAEWLRTKGWKQGEYNPGGRGCLVGAIVSVQGFKSMSEAGSNINEWESLQALAPSSPICEAELVHWNDTRGRTLGEVLDRLESTALGLEIRALAANSAAGSSRIAEPERELVTQPFEVKK